MILWTVLTVLSFLLTLAALAYTNAITNHTSGQSIDISQLQDSSASAKPYPVDTWTPQTWYGAVLELPFVHEGDKSDIRHHLRIMEGWRWNLIPLFLLELAIVPLVVLEFMKTRREDRRKRGILDNVVAEK